MDISYYQHAVNPHITPAKARTDWSNDIVILMGASQKLVPNGMTSRLGDLKTETKRKKPASQQVNETVKDSYNNQAVQINAKNVSINNNGSSRGQSSSEASLSSPTTWGRRSSTRSSETLSTPSPAFPPAAISLASSSTPTLTAPTSSSTSIVTQVPSTPDPHLYSLVSS